MTASPPLRPTEPPASLVFAPGDLRLPRWTFTAWVVYCRDWAHAARPSLSRRAGSARTDAANDAAILSPAA